MCKFGLINLFITCFQNPSKPHFNHYMFESICLSIRITCKANPEAVGSFEEALFLVFTEILQNDVQGKDRPSVPGLSALGLPARIYLMAGFCSTANSRGETAFSQSEVFRLFHRVCQQHSLTLNCIFKNHLAITTPEPLNTIINTITLFVVVSFLCSGTLKGIGNGKCIYAILANFWNNYIWEDRFLQSFIY